MTRDFRFWHQLRVRYRDVDMQHIVYYAVYLEYFDVAIHEYFRSLGINIAETAETSEFDTATVHVEVDYLQPARFDQILNIGVRVERVGDKSFEIVIEVGQLGTDVVLCRGRLVFVNFDRSTGQAHPVPARVRAAIQAREEIPV